MFFNLFRKKPQEAGKMIGGERRSAQNKEEFINLCQDLSSEFMGVMRLYSKTEGKKYSAALLLEKGDIIGASFEDEAEQITTFKEDALENIKNKLSGTVGDLEIFSFKEGDIESVKSQNPEVILSEPVSFSNLGIKIRLNLVTEETEKQNAGDKNGLQVKQINIGSKFRLIEFARGIPVSVSIPKILEKPATPEIKKIEVNKPKTPNQNEDRKNMLEIDLKLKAQEGKIGLPLSAAKAERLAELKRQRQKEDLELMKRISQIKAKKEEQKPAQVCKVETSIDRLYQLVQKQGRVKIDEELAKQLGVSKAQIESWSLILEEHNLVDLHYPAIGEPEIRKKEDRK